MTPWAKAALSDEEAAVIEARGRALGVRIGALYSSRHRQWSVTVGRGEQTVRVKGKGPLAAVFAGAFDDYEEAFGVTA